MTHSWFILFHQACTTSFPKWFQTWFNYFGLAKQFYSVLLVKDLNTSKLLKNDFEVSRNKSLNSMSKKLFKDSKLNGRQNFIIQAVVPMLTHGFKIKKNIDIPKISKKDQEKHANFLTEKSRLL